MWNPGKQKQGQTKVTWVEYIYSSETFISDRGDIENYLTSYVHK